MVQEVSSVRKTRAQVLTRTFYLTKNIDPLSLQEFLENRTLERKAEKLIVFFFFLKNFF